jgi:hypothetical protein
LGFELPSGLMEFDWRLASTRFSLRKRFEVTTAAFSTPYIITEDVSSFFGGQ